MGLDQEGRRLLDGAQHEDDESDQIVSFSTRSDTNSTKKRHILIALLCTVALLSNAFWAFYSFGTRNKTQRHAYYATAGRPANIDTSFDFQWFDFDNTSRVFRDDLWTDDMPTGGGMLALTPSYAASLGLDRSIKSPQDAEKEVYFLAGYHHVHCLAVMKDTIMNMNTTAPETLNWGHLLHCIDAMRQAAWCNLDTTILRVNNLEVTPLDAKNGPVDGQTHVCTNRHALKAWTEQHYWVP